MNIATRLAPDRRLVTSFIDGAAAATGPGTLIEVIDPATEQVVGELREADAGEVGQAVAAARRAFDTGPWPRMSSDERKAILYRIRDVILQHRDELLALEVMNTGLPVASVAWQVSRAAANFEMFADVASTLAGQTFTQDPRYLTYVTREPKGVAALIAPWNAPLALASMRIATCIAFGNTCVLKPSEYTPHSILRMVELCHVAGLPNGVLNLVNGRGHVTGESLVSHPGIDMVGFTGGSETGRSIMAAAGRNLKPCILELGGKSASIVFDSADLDQAIDGTLMGIFSNNGQQCLAGSRILIQRSVADRYIDAFTRRARAIRIGNPLDPNTEMGPLAFRRHMERVLSFADIARAEGGEILTGGKRAEGFDAGYYVEPTIVLAKDNEARVCQEEIFGPFASLVLFDDPEEAVAIANASAFGLVSYVWSNDLAVTMKASRDIRAGTIWVNTPMMRELRAPFGGYKESGIGRDGMSSSADFFTELKTTSIPYGRIAIPRIGLGG
ncbi:aldehyde dehydrogenase [Sphingomonas immobilis]|uniref:Aldehyde dehydrogenase n=1 Tax=Sphingomonas immobilis TaxID=3063997 RepID=A0ABT9A0Q1_9SPHN|nr:aldehyde dehydrogenase [Sphingomonas sp. CA1-15]MDO7843406.1 aldehyde dehydrogenase [Sphingomonas sp. CA1-15]